MSWLNLTYQVHVNGQLEKKKNILKVKMQRNHKNTYSLSANEPTTVPNTMEEPNPTTKSWLICLDVIP